MSIEGIPDGWELVRIGRPSINERYIGLNGLVINCVAMPNGKGYAIVRKIEKPKRYRPFNDPIEGQPLIGEVLRLKVDHKSIGVFIGITSLGFQIGLSHWKPKEAFDCFERLDGTPFGIEVTE